ncbi:MAG: hypothetical protein Q4D24_00755 [Erysipelotrichaceae bacterium]|nr:hypothetical protein [Erysipelotrichaceae bacterium]
MKKLIVSAAVSLILTLTGLFVNYMYYQNNKSLLLAYRMYGGEITAEKGFGLSVTHIYAMTPDGRDSLSCRFDPIGFILTFLLLTLIIWLVWTIIAMIRRPRSAA